ncbi:MAG: hypothetical protein JWR50_411 [Mucilaginibacter sp.]|nr:hypothetical protein [Mucilaginibacter sp.]
MHKLLSAQYDEVKGARGALFAYCNTVSNTDLLKTLLNLMIHQF